MTDTTIYRKASKTQSTGQWVTTGVVVTSTETGQFKALMPVLNSYSEIMPESIKPVDEDTFYADDGVASAYLRAANVKISSTSTSADPAILNGAEGFSVPDGLGEDIAVKHGASIDIQQLSMMIGLASLTGAATNIASNLMMGANAPQLIVIGLSAAAFVFGRFLPSKLRRTQNG